MGRLPAELGWEAIYPSIKQPCGKRPSKRSNCYSCDTQKEPRFGINTVLFPCHVHEPPFKPAGNWADRIGPTWVFNAGRQIGPVPCAIEIDLGGGTATWRSMLGSETLLLQDTQAPQRSVF